MASSGVRDGAETVIGLEWSQYFRDKKVGVFTFFWADNFLSVRRLSTP